MANNGTASVITIPCRLAFPEVFEPKAFDGGEAKFSVTLLFPKDGARLISRDELYDETKADLLGLRKLVFEAITNSWGTEKQKWPSNLRVDPRTYVSPNGKDGWPVRDGDAVDWDGFEGHWFIRATSKKRPGVLNAGKHEILDPGEVFGGLICRAQINAYPYDNKSKGVSFGLSNLQILKDDGTTYESGRQKASEAFEAFDDGDAATGAAGEAW